MSICSVFVVALSGGSLGVSEEDPRGFISSSLKPTSNTLLRHIADCTWLRGVLPLGSFSN